VRRNIVQKSTHKKMKALFTFIIGYLILSNNLAAQCSAYFTSSQVPNTLMVNFTDVTTPVNAIKMWTFGDNQTGSGGGVQHLYATPGNYVVCLTIIDSLTNCQASYCDTILVASGSMSCDPAFTFTIGQNGVVTFTNTSLPSTSNYSFLWDFGDNQTSTQVNPTHTYAATGSYVVVLTMTGGNCNDSYIDTVSIITNGQPCAAMFNVLSSVGNTVQFFNTSLPSLAGYSFQWSFGDNQTSSAISASHTYASAGTYLVCLTMWDSTCQSSYCDTIVVNGNQQPCQAAFTYTQNGAGQVQFTNTSLPGTAGYFFSWNFGNSQSSSAVNPSTTYSATGNYIVCLTMFDSTCQSTVCDTIQVVISGMSELDQLGWALYPNPVNEILSVQSSVVLRGMQYRILDISGREVDAGVFSESRIEIGSLLSGVYLLSVTDNDGNVSVKRFMKQ
jgi:PKD repeat protein